MTARDGVDRIDNRVVHTAAVLRMRMAQHDRARRTSGLFEVRFEKTHGRWDHHQGELVIGGGTDPYNNYSQRGSFTALEHTVTALVETFPIISRLRMLRQWGGIVDMTGDRSPILSKTDVEGLYVNCGWGTGGFKAIPGSGLVFADTMANDRPHPIAAPFSLNRFKEGRLIDESVAAAVAH